MCSGCRLAQIKCLHTHRPIAGGGGGGGGRDGVGGVGGGGQTKNLTPPQGYGAWVLTLFSCYYNTVKHWNVTQSNDKLIFPKLFGS